LCPDWEDWSPADGTANATEAMDAAEQWLDVPQVAYIHRGRPLPRTVICMLYNCLEWDK